MWTRASVSRVSVRSVTLPLSAGSNRSATFVSGAGTDLLLNPTPVPPDCHGKWNFMSGSHGRPLSSSRTLASAVGTFAALISSAQPASTTLAAIQSVSTMMSQPVETPASSCGRIVAMKDSLSSICAFA